MSDWHPHVNVPDGVENVDAYVRAAEARIKANAFRGRQKRWHAEDPTRQALVDRLHELVYGKEDPFHRFDADDSEYPRWIAPKYVNPFLAKMQTSLEEWGTLTPGQEAAVRKVMADDEAKQAERKAARAAEDAASTHVGTVGERREWDVTLRFTTSFETAYGELHVHVGRDLDGNVIVYKGSKRIGEKGDHLVFTATVKEHGVREGVNQTIVARPANVRRVVPAEGN